jgi:hypothetical protein
MSNEEEILEKLDQIQADVDHMRSEQTKFTVWLRNVVLSLPADLAQKMVDKQAG